MPRKGGVTSTSVSVPMRKVKAASPRQILQTARSLVMLSHSGIRRCTLSKGARW